MIPYVLLRLFDLRGSFCSSWLVLFVVCVCLFYSWVCWFDDSFACLFVVCLLQFLCFMYYMFACSFVCITCVCVNCTVRVVHARE